MADEHVEKASRYVKREARVKRARELAAVNRVRISPSTEEFRKVIRHPRYGGFRSTGSISWPLDNFTRRRIRDGSVIVENGAEAQARQDARQEKPQAGASRPPSTPTI
jgi:hypothetical protein